MANLAHIEIFPHQTIVHPFAGADFRDVLPELVANVSENENGILIWSGFRIPFEVVGRKIIMTAPQPLSFLNRDISDFNAR